MTVSKSSLTQSLTAMTDMEKEVHALLTAGGASEKDVAKKETAELEAKVPLGSTIHVYCSRGNGSRCSAGHGWATDRSHAGGVMEAGFRGFLVSWGPHAVGGGRDVLWFHPLSQAEVEVVPSEHCIVADYWLSSAQALLSMRSAAHP